MEYMDGGATNIVAIQVIREHKSNNNNNNKKMI